MLTLFATVLFLLLFCHCLADYPLQGDFLSRLKSRRDPPAGPGLWYVGLSTHACIHAGFVFLVTGNLVLAAMEFVAHWGIDWSKGEGKIGFKTDQGLHVLCKVAWALIAVTIVPTRPILGGF